ncbi:hypothetical protein RHMOL_RhmolUnG0000300 [Rhododendron molle]|nr:hypothetical protein RHMOL_RhmolUnG0000300 [Rhododendron molle]
MEEDLGGSVAQSVTTEAPGCTLSREDSPPTSPHEASPSPPSSPKPVKIEAIVMAENPPPTLVAVLADIQRNMAAMQQRADHSTIFNPTDHITPEHNRKPVVLAPVEPEVNILAVGWEMEDKMAEWMELSNDWTERYHLGFPAAPQIDQVWIDQLEAEWEAA